MAHSIDVHLNSFCVYFFFSLFFCGEFFSQVLLTQFHFCILNRTQTSTCFSFAHIFLVYCLVLDRMHTSVTVNWRSDTTFTLSVIDVVCMNIKTAQSDKKICDIFINEIAVRATETVKRNQLNETKQKCFAISSIYRLATTT